MSSKKSQLSHQLQKGIIFLFHLLVILTPFFFTWVNEELFEFPKMLLVYGLSLLIVGLWGGRMVIEKRFIIKNTPLDWPLLIFVFSQLLSTIFSIHPYTSFWGYYTRFHGGLLSTLTYAVLYYALVSNFSFAQIKKLWLSALIAGLGVSLYGIPEHFGHSPSCLLITQSFDVACWVQDVQTRIFATFGQPNWLAAYAITLFPLSVTWGMLNLSSAKEKSKKNWQKVSFFILTSVSLVVTLLFTQSRSGFLGWVAGLLFLESSFIWLRFQKGITKKQSRFALGLSGFLLGIVLVLGSSFTPSLLDVISSKKNSAEPASATTQSPEASQRVVNRLETGGTDSGEIRKIVWQGAIDVWRRSPILGSGVETFAYSYYQDRPVEHNKVSEWDFLYNKAHNEFLNFLANSGLVGLASYLFLLGSFVWINARHLFENSQKSETNHQDSLVLLSLLAGLLGLSISNFFGFSTVVVTVLMFAGFATSSIIISTDNEKNVAQKTAPLGFLQTGQLIVLSLMVLWGVSKVVNIFKADRAYAAGKMYISANYAQKGLDELEKAVKLRPREALYHNQLADAYSKIAVALENEQQSTAAAKFTQGALGESHLALQLNPRHLNFYKAKVRILIQLAPFNPQLLVQAEETLHQALKLAPTDAKLLYNLGLVELSLEKTELGIETLKKTILLKPNYEVARMALAKQYEQQQKPGLALEQYQYIYDHITRTNQIVNQKLGKE